jgi:hypothetical protein
MSGSLRFVINSHGISLVVLAALMGRPVSAEPASTLVPSPSLTRVEDTEKLKESQATSKKISKAETKKSNPAPVETKPSDESIKKTKPIKSRQAIGWVEEVSFGPVKVQARLDTGITSNQLNAGDLSFFKREGATWARFRLHGVKGELALVEKPLEVRDGKATASKRYPRIRIGFCLAGRYAEDVFKLRDRSGFEHKVLLGRDVLAGFFTVDPARTVTTEAKCQTWDKGVVLEERDNQD